MTHHGQPNKYMTGAFHTSIVGVCYCSTPCPALTDVDKEMQGSYFLHLLLFTFLGSSKASVSAEVGIAS